MDIKSGCGYPASSLSNFSPHSFQIDGVNCASMEGFLQSLKFKDIPMQRYVCTLVGSKAKYTGKHKRWYDTQTLWWNGKEIDRHGKEYQDLLDKAYSRLATNEKFAAALLATGDAVLTHSIGKNKESETVLTTREFCGRLMKIRSELKNGK